jgi:nitrogen fixation-related uncharacterized protein
MSAIIEKLLPYILMVAVAIWGVYWAARNRRYWFKDGWKHKWK